MLKIHVKLLNTVRLIAIRDMEVGMVYKGNKGLPKLVVHKTSRSMVVRNIGEEKVMTVALYPKPRRRQKSGCIKPMKVFAIAKDDPRDIEKLVNKTQTV